MGGSTSIASEMFMIVEATTRRSHYRYPWKSTGEEARTLRPRTQRRRARWPKPTHDARRRSTNTSPTTPVYGSSGVVAQPIFPAAFGVYCLSARHYVIGETRHRPLYAVSTHSALSSKPDLIIYNGASEDTPPLAFIDHEPFSRSAGITLPARQGSRFPASHAVLESVGPFTRVMSFDIETTAASASGGVLEHFEWRHSSGIEVSALGEGRHSGWKLVRESSPPSTTTTTTTTTTTKKKTRKHSTAGKEVVAVWVGPSFFASRVLRFQFLGSAADGSLGDRWAVMAVASALAIWNRDRRLRSRGLAAASV
ncbi:hypothetical protein CIB48_g10904 [Xylaria polymorpha]|nr:hypothetical protein CIB48_g10904 [Xylaria polymorpha]